MLNKIDSWLKKSYNSCFIIKIIIDKIKVSSLFWRYRHFFHQNIWQSYLYSFNEKRRFYYSGIVDEYNLKYIFEFGCASGPNLMNIERYSKKKTVLFGYDINKKSIKIARNSFNSKNTYFFSSINYNNIINLINKFNIDNFDLVIFDRVLYLLSEKQLDSHLEKFKNFYKYVVIDDFYNANETKTNGAYFSKDYISIFDKYGFNLITIEQSEHPAKTIFFKENAKRILFKNKAY